MRNLHVSFSLLALIYIHKFSKFLVLTSLFFSILLGFGVQTSLNVLATPLRNINQKPNNPPKEDKKNKKVQAVQKKPKREKAREKLEKLEALSKRLRHCILKRVNHRRHRSS